MAKKYDDDKPIDTETSNGLNQLEHLNDTQGTDDQDADDRFQLKVVNYDAFVDFMHKTSNVITFGDSFSQSSKVKTWAGFVTERFGFKFIDDENNFAVQGEPSSDLANQFARYIECHKYVDPNALYLIYSGLNDLFQIKDTLIQDMHAFHSRYLPSLPFDTSQNGILKGMLSGRVQLPNTSKFLFALDNNISNILKSLQNGGAEHIIVLDTFDESYRLKEAITGLDEDGIHLFGAVLQKILNSAIYTSINNAVDPSKIICIPYGKFVEDVSNNPQKYLSEQDIEGTTYGCGFFDGTPVGPLKVPHPTEAAHKLTANYVESKLVDYVNYYTDLKELAISGDVNERAEGGNCSIS